MRRSKPRLRSFASSGAILVDIKTFDDKLIGKNENLVLLTELKADMAKYLKSSPAPIGVRSLADVIAFDKAHERQEMSLFGQDTFENAQKTKGLNDPAYKKAREISFQAAGPNGIDRLLKDNTGWSRSSDRRCRPSWNIDAVNGDQISPAGAPARLRPSPVTRT